MTGVKGKSGKVATPEQREKRRAAARAGGQAKSRAKISTNDAAFAVNDWISRKDQLACELLERKIEAADIDVETAAAKRDQERGKLLTLVQVRARDEKSADIFRRGLLSFADLVSQWVPADKIIQAQSIFREHAEKTLGAIADEIAP